MESGKTQWIAGGRKKWYDMLKKLTVIHLWLFSGTSSPLPRLEEEEIDR